MLEQMARDQAKQNFKHDSIIQTSIDSYFIYLLPIFSYRCRNNSDNETVSKINKEGMEGDRREVQRWRSTYVQRKENLFLQRRETSMQ